MHAEIQEESSSSQGTMMRHRPLAHTNQRRILSKPIRPTFSALEEDDEEDVGPISTMRYIYYLSLAGGCWYFNYTRASAWIGTLSTLHWIGVVSRILTTLRKSTNVHQIAGTVALRQRMYYYVDYWLSTFPYAKGVVLLSLTLALILTSGTLISYMADEPWIESLWAAALGSGLDWGFINSKSASLRFIAVCTNVGGLVVTALLLSLISDAVQTKYDSLRKGSSPVTESGHTLIIGWSLKTLSVMEQLAKASESKGKDTIVCLTDTREKEDMEAEIASYDFKFGKLGTRVVCRSGSPLVYSELQRVSFSKARSIIILAGDTTDAEGNDAKSLHILMSIVASLEREKIFRTDLNDYERYAGPILHGIMNVSHSPQSLSEEEELICRERKVVIEVMDSDNAAIMASVSPGLVEPVMANDVVGRLMLQAARNPLVADVWQDLLGFDGCEPYATQWGILRGLRFKEVLLCFEDAIPLGIKTSLGEVILNPQDGYIIKQGDEIIVLAEDDDSYHASITHSLVRTQGRKIANAGVGHLGNAYGRMRLPRQATGVAGLEAIRRFASVERNQSSSVYPLKISHKDTSVPDSVERILFCGWRFDMGALLQVFCAVAPPGSEFWILSELDLPARQKELKMQGFDASIAESKMQVVHRVGSCRRKALERLPLESFTGIIVGAESTSPDRDRSAEAHNVSESMADADARVIAAVMMIQDLISKREQKNNMKANEDLPSHLAHVFSSSCEGSYSSDPQIIRQSSMLFGPERVNAISRRCVIVGEIVDSRSRAMLGMVNAIDAVVASNELVSKAIAMVSEDASVNKVLSNLFDPYGSEITLERVKTYVDVDHSEEVSFFELMIRGREYGTIVLGHLEREEEALGGYESASVDTATIKYTGVILNPPDKALRRKWHPDDLLIVLMSMESRENTEEDVDEEVPETIEVEGAQELNLSHPDDLGKDTWLDMPKKQCSKDKRQISFAV